MTEIIIAIAKYIMIILITVYTVLAFTYLRGKTHRGRNFVNAMQIFCIIALHLTGYLAILAYTGTAYLIFLYAAQLLFFVLYLALFRLIYPRASRMLLNNSCMLLAVSFIMLTRLDESKGVRQSVITVFAAIVALIVPVAVRKLKDLWKPGWIYGIIGMAALLAVLLYGSQTNGSYLSFDIGGIVSLQPSEFVKITFVFFVASMFQHSISFKRAVVTTAVAIVHVLILVASTDLGAALIYYIAYLLMLFVATKSYLYLLGGLGCGCVAAIFAYFAFAHVQTRVAVWIDPWIDPTGDSYQILQSLFAIGSGGWLGSGLYLGSPEYIPLAYSDFIFSAICEEMGGIFAMMIVLIYLSCLLQFLWISTWMDGMFYKIVAFGLAAVFGSQVFLNVGGVIKLIPSTGITLPFVSYGGSSITSTFIMFGIIQGLYILKQDEVDRIEKERLETEKRAQQRVRGQAVHQKGSEEGPKGAENSAEGRKRVKQS